MDSQSYWGSEFSVREVEEARKRGGLLSMELELSRECNLRCVYCYANSGQKLSNELTLDEILEALDQAISLGARKIIILGGGEPLMYPHIDEVFRYIRKRGAAMDLFTNGTLIDKARARDLFSLGVSPVVKLNSLKQDVQDRLANKSGTFEAIQKGLQNLMEAGYPSASMPLGVETIICRQNIAELPQMWVWARERKIVPYFEMITFQGRARKNLDLNVTSDEIHALFKELSTLDRERYGIEWDPHPPIAALSCNRHSYSCTLNAQGYVQPCTGVDIKIGSIRHAPLAEIIKTSAVLGQLREARKHIKGACVDCELGCMCYGCRGLAYHVTGDYLESDPLCWRNPKKVM